MYITVDIETAESTGLDHTAKTLVLAVLYDSATDTYTRVWHSKQQVIEMLRAKTRAGYQVVGHNVLGFDLMVLGGDALVAELKDATVDTMTWVNRVTEAKGAAKLDTIATETLGYGKVKLETGAAELGQRALAGDTAAAEELARYCEQDVKATWMVAQHGITWGWVATKANGKRLEVKAII